MQAKQYAMANTMVPPDLRSMHSRSLIVEVANAIGRKLGEYVSMTSIPLEELSPIIAEAALNAVGSVDFPKLVAQERTNSRGESRMDINHEELEAAVRTNIDEDGKLFYPPFVRVVFSAYLAKCDEVRELRDALEFYAKDHQNPNEGPWGVNSRDFGQCARKALERDRHSTPTEE
jgi:hypothetical protein